MKAQLIRVELSDKAWYFNNYYYKCIDCGAEYTRHQYNERINPYCGACQRKHDTEAQKQRNINHKNKLIIEELVKIKTEIQELEKTFYIETSVYDIIDEHISELKENKLTCDRNICLQNEYNNIGCEDCVVMNGE